MLLGVEEVRRLQVAGEVLVVDDDARDLGGALEAAVGERRSDLAERPGTSSRRCA